MGDHRASGDSRGATTDMIPRGLSPLLLLLLDQASRRVSEAGVDGATANTVLRGLSPLLLLLLDQASRRGPEAGEDGASIDWGRVEEFEFLPLMMIRYDNSDL